MTLCLHECGDHEDPNGAFCYLDLGHDGPCSPSGMPTRISRAPSYPMYVPRND